MKCSNGKVVAALAVVGLGVYALAPNLAAPATPLLVLALCPLSMLLMVPAMGSGSSRSWRGATRARTRAGSSAG